MPRKFQGNSWLDKSGFWRLEIGETSLDQSAAGGLWVFRKIDPERWCLLIAPSPFTDSLILIGWAGRRIFRGHLFARVGHEVD